MRDFLMLSLIATAACAGGATNGSGKSSEPLRAFGMVKCEQTAYPDTNSGDMWSVEFRCEQTANAATVAGKFLADLQQSIGTERRELDVAGRAIPIYVAPGGAAFVASVSDRTASILCAASVAALAAGLDSHPELAAGAAAAFPYPQYLDRFDHWGWGLYGLGGFDNMHGWMDRAGGVGQADPMEDLEWMAQNKLRFEAWLDPLLCDTSDGLEKNNGTEWMVREATKRNLPVSFRLYGTSGEAEWTARRFAEYFEQPAPFLMSGWHGPEQFWKARRHYSWYQPDIHRYVAVKAMDMMRPYVNEPKVLGWMHPHGELFHDPWFDMHDDYSTAAQASWHAYLKQNRIAIADLNRMYARETPFASLSAVPVPEFATFSGLPGMVLDLAGPWQYRVENSTAFAPDEAWWQKPVAEKYSGVQGAWWDDATDATDWTAIDLPGSDAIFGVFRDGNAHNASTWFRREFSLESPPAGKRVFLYAFPLSFGGIHAGDHARFHDTYVNGNNVGAFGAWGALDVTDALRPGENRLAVHVMGSRWNGRIFLSTSEPKIFPYLGKDANHLWQLWQSWHLESREHAWSEILDGMRQVDPNRPIKFMAPAGFGADRYLKLARRWGAWPHFTGEGIWFYPWFKRYAYLYDLPATSELAGPCNNVDEQFEGYRRAFLAGLNGHEPVFMAQSYSRNPELRRWWEEHLPVLRRMGSYDLDGPQVLILRSTRGDIVDAPIPHPELGIASREIQNPFNWDLGRGTFQTIGQSYLYLDEGGVADGKMRDYKVMIDGGNETLSADTIGHIQGWVRAGGTFIALPFTGRNELMEPDTWPIRALTGCEIGALRKPGNGTVTIATNQTILKHLAGRTFPDAGRALDNFETNHNLTSVELKPDADAEVLATYENGAPALVRRKLGKGSVIVLGSAFWRDSQDRRGIWWPEQIETDFVADLLAGIGFDAPTCETSDRLIWAQPYRSNNGLDTVAMLVSWRDDNVAALEIRLRTPTKPAALTAVGVDGTQPLAFEWKDGVATATLPMPAREVKFLNATAHAPTDAVQHWWTYQQKMWHALAKPTIDFAPYRKGKWEDPTLDLRQGAAFTQSAPATNWTSPDFDDKSWTACELGALHLEGATAGKPTYVRKRFEVPAKWLGAGAIYLTSGAWTGPQYLDPARMFVNGHRIHDFATEGFWETDVTPLLSNGTNVVAFEFKGESRFLGFTGNVWLYLRKPAEASIDLSGNWAGTDREGKRFTATFPGTAIVKSPTRIIAMPPNWEGKYRVRLVLEGDRSSALGAFVNNRLVRRHHHNLGERCDIDITDYLRFGAFNTLTLAQGNDWQGVDLRPGETPSWNLRVLRLDVFPK